MFLTTAGLLVETGGCGLARLMSGSSSKQGGLYKTHRISDQDVHLLNQGKGLDESLRNDVSRQEQLGEPLASCIALAWGAEH